MSSGWFLARPGGSPIGPLRAEALLRRIRGGTLSPDELVWKEGMEDWVAIGDVPQLAVAIARDEPQAEPRRGQQDGTSAAEPRRGQHYEEPEEQEEQYPATIREPTVSMDFPDDAPETKRGTVSRSLLEKAGRPKPRPQVEARVVGPRPSLTRVLEDPRPVVASPVADVETRESPVATARFEPDDKDPALAPRRLELAVESVPLTRNFGSRGMVIATPVDERDIPLAPDAAGPVEPPPRTVRLPNLALQATIPVYENAAYDQLAAEQEEPAPNSGPPPPYPPNFPTSAAAVPETRAPMLSHTLVLPQAAALQAADRLSQPPAPLPAPPAAANAPQRKGGGRWVLVLVLFVLIGVGLGLLGARYVVHFRAAHALPSATSTP